MIWLIVGLVSIGIVGVFYFVNQQGEESSEQEESEINGQETQSESINQLSNPEDYGEYSIYAKIANELKNRLEIS